MATHNLEEISQVELSKAKSLDGDPAYARMRSVLLGAVHESVTAGAVCVEDIPKTDVEALGARFNDLGAAHYKVDELEQIPLFITEGISPVLHSIDPAHNLAISQGRINSKAEFREVESHLDGTALPELGQLALTFLIPIAGPEARFFHADGPFSFYADSVKIPRYVNELSYGVGKLIVLRQELLVRNEDTVSVYHPESHAGHCSSGEREIVALDMYINGPINL